MSRTDLETQTELSSVTKAGAVAEREEPLLDLVEGANAKAEGQLGRADVLLILSIFGIIFALQHYLNSDYY